MKMASDYEKSLGQLMQMVDTWQRGYVNVWNDHRQSILAKANDLLPDQVTEQLLRDTSELAHRLQMMAYEASNLAGQNRKGHVQA